LAAAAPPYAALAAREIVTRRSRGRCEERGHAGGFRSSVLLGGGFRLTGSFSTLEM
jgi:hypothetical protein